jgi:hypothetical protein
MSEPEREVSFARLVDWLEGRLSEEDARAVEQQVAIADDTVRADVAWLRKFVEAAENLALESPPAEVRDTLIARFEAYAQERRAPGLLRRLTATLLSDGGLQPAFGLRRENAHGSRRQLIYSADTLDVALNFWVRAHDENLELFGQIFPREDFESEAFGVQLLRGTTEVATMTADNLGRFHLESISPGVYEVILSTSWVEVSIVSVDLNS